jgi:hypothetical protein
MGKVSIAIIHYPVLDKQGDVVATSLNNLELHDVARSCMTYGVEMCYIVTPLRKQREIAEKLISHWTEGYGIRYNPDRAKALRKISIAHEIDEVFTELQAQGNPVVIGTSSKGKGVPIGDAEMRTWIERDEQPFLILFGTGWGLPPEMTARCNRMLLPVKGKGEYNHLSLRVAIGIILDRLLGERGEAK